MAVLKDIVLAVIVIGLITSVGFSQSDLLGYAPKKADDLCPKIGQASLELDTPDCPTSLGGMSCEERTSWLIEKVSDTDPLTDPQNAPISYTVKVMEGSTEGAIATKGQIVITNSGGQTPFLSSVVVNLQDVSKKPFTVATAVAVKNKTCRDGEGLEGAQTCLGQFTNSPDARLILTDPDNNDVIALTEVPIPPAQSCDNATIINYEAEFDLSETGLNSGDLARIEVLATFSGAGRRGKSHASCTVDADCNSVIDKDSPTTCEVNEGEEKNVRTVQQRSTFIIPDFDSCDEICPSVIKTDVGAIALNYACAEAGTNTLIDIIYKRYEGAVTFEEISGVASCRGGNCSTDIVNVAELRCIDRRNELIEGSPAGAYIPVVCEEGIEPEMSVGDFCTFTQSSWGTICWEDSPACFRDAHFDSVFSSGVGIGEGVTCSAGSCGQSPVLDGYPSAAAIWTTSSAVEAYLPKGGYPGRLIADLTDPLSTSSGILDAQLLAATLSVAYDDAGKFDIGPPYKKNDPSKKLGDLTYQGGTPCDGLTVRQVINEANEFVSGGTPSLTATQLTQCLNTLNGGFVYCMIADTRHFR